MWEKDIRQYATLHYDMQGTQAQANPFSIYKGLVSNTP